MNLKTYLQSHWQGRSREFAQKVGLAYIYMHQISSGHRRPSTDMAKRISEGSDGLVGLHDLRPDVWAPTPGEAPASEAA